MDLQANCISSQKKSEQFGISEGLGLFNKLY